MSFAQYSGVVAEGDTVVLYQSRDSLLSLSAQHGKVQHHRLGSFRHDDIIGKEYGSKVWSDKKDRWMLVLHPTPELWTGVLPHRTQILYVADISAITLHLDLKPGAIVCESGTGSGSLTHSLARTVMPTGHVHTFEFHEQRAAQAREEFKAHGLERFVTVTCTDVCLNGFGMTDQADAVFLDLPSPWEAAHWARKALKSTGARLCSFSPCIEQVSRMCDALRTEGFTDIRTFECILRPFNVKRLNFDKLPTADDTDTATAASKGRKRPREDEAPANATEADMQGHGAAASTAPHAPHTPAHTAPAMSARPYPEMRGHTGYLTFATLEAGAGAGLAANADAAAD
eukprot:Opistho-2@28184